MNNHKNGSTVCKNKSKTKKDNTGRQFVKIEGTCLCCGRNEILTPQQILDAQQSGAASSSCCYFPMTIKSASIVPIFKQFK